MGNIGLLRLLKEAGGNMDSSSDTGSTVVLAACYMLRFEIVKYLLLNKVNIHTANVKGVTCLMCAVHNVDIIRLLVLNGAEANRSDFRGNTAMHYAAEDGQLTVVKILHEVGGNPLLVNHDGYSVIGTAAKYRRREITEFLLQVSPSLKVEDVVDIYELYGSMAILLDHDLEGGYSFFHKATTLRFINKANVGMKKTSRVSELGKAENIVEFNTLSELMQLKENPAMLSIQALLVCERQRGWLQDSYLQLLIYCGVSFADRMDFRKAANLWKLSYALNYKKYVVAERFCPEPLNQHLTKTVFSVVKLLCQWKREDSIGFDDMVEDESATMYHRVSEPTMRDILLLLCDHTSASQQHLQRSSLQFREKYQNHHSLLMRSLLVLLSIYIDSYSVSDWCDSVWQRLQSMIRNSFKCHYGLTFLHLGTSFDTVQLLGIDPVSQYISWPSCSLIKILLLLGSDPTAKDERGNSPLHLAVNLQQAETFVIVGIANYLLGKGAHPDQVNSLNQTAIDLALSAEVRQCLFQHVSLKCLAARVITNFEIPYLDEIPSDLYSFIKLHTSTKLKPISDGASSI